MHAEMLKCDMGRILVSSLCEEREAEFIVTAADEADKTNTEVTAFTYLYCH